VAQNYQGRHQAGLEAATARVQTLRPDGAVVAYGTGVFVAPGLLATCAHVVPPVPSDPVAGDAQYVVFSGGQRLPAQVLVCDPVDAAAELYSYPDVALLQVPFTDHPCIRVAERDPGPSLYAYGCILVGRQRMWDPMLLTVEGWRRLGEGRAVGEPFFLKTSGGQVHAGSSGGGAIDLATGELIGLVKISRNERLDLGAVLVPADSMLNTFAAAGHDIRAANQDATQDAATLAGQVRRLGWAWKWLLGVLENLKLGQLQLMLAELDIDDGENLTLPDIAALLLHRELDDLGSALEILAQASRSFDLTKQVLEGSAPFAMLGARPWVDQDGVEALARERLRPAPRVVHLSVCERQTVTWYATRSAGLKSWTVLHLSPSDAVLTSDGALQEQLDVAVRAELLGRIGRGFEVSDRAAFEAAWQQAGARALRQASKVLFLLPPEVIDRGTLDGLRRRYPSCVFALATTTLPAALQDEDELLLSLPGSIPATDEADAISRYEDIVFQIREAAVR
jgi:hypothetical protein